MKDVYICGTFRNDWNKEFNLKLESALVEHGISCYLPQRDTEQTGDKKRTFEQNVQGINNSRVIVAIGTKIQTANWGFEVGYAFAKGKPVIVLTDREHEVELMPSGAVSKIMTISNIDDIEEYLSELLVFVR